MFSAGIILTGLMMLAWMARSVPQVPYNVRELFVSRNLLQTVVLLGATLYLAAVPPVAFAAYLNKGSWKRAIALPGLVLLHACIVWLALRDAVPAESLHDILGTPILHWPWEWELLVRFIALFGGPSIILTGLALVLIRRTNKQSILNGKLLSWLLVATIILPLCHWGVVTQAATDNLTELMRGGGSWLSSLFIAAWVAVLGFSASRLSIAAATYGRKWKRAVGSALLFVPLAYLLISLGTGQSIYKYHQVFSALQFLLSPDRTHLISGPTLFVLYAVVHVVAVVAGAVLQYPVWLWHVQPIGDRVTAPTPLRREAGTTRLAGLLGLAYVGLLIYGTLFPLSGWHRADHATLTVLLANWPKHASLADVFTNFIVYLPLGFLAAQSLRRGLTPWLAVTTSALACLVLSTTLEYLQFFVPNRTPSSLDIFVNTAGGAAGALLGTVIHGQTTLGNRLRRLREFWARPGRVADIGLVAIGLWAIANTSPLVPSFDVGNLRQGVAPLWQTLSGDRPFAFAISLSYALEIFAVGALLRTLVAAGRSVTPVFLLLVTTVTMLSVPVVERQLSLEMLVGLVIGIALYAGLGPTRMPALRLTAALAVTGAFVIGTLHAEPAATGLTYPFNWVPFVQHMQHPERLLDSLGGIWPFVALAYLVMLAKPVRPVRVVIGGGALILVLALVLELAQQGISGRHGDITDVILAVLGWLLPWLFRNEAGEQAAPTEPSAKPASIGSGRKPRAAPLATAAIALGVGLWLLWPSAHGPTEQALDETTLPTLPSPETLPPAALPHFHYAHPRLPAPSARDIAAIRVNNPQYFRRHRRFAQSQRGRLYSKTLMAYVVPGGRALGPLYNELMALKFSGRGNVQVKPLAVAYDWLYDQWTPTQRQALRGKLLDGCRFVIGVIRDQRLSPYNVFLYNSPMQALMACAITTYGDAPEAEPVMRFTYDMWKNRILPVWRQVLGKNGGWHEGGEYVGIGIGQAIYQLPAMWRKVTGEDYFKTEPEIRGFLDFLVYRTRPDGTHFRWGDAGFFRRIVPDRIPLAIEYGDAAAFSLKGRPRFEPTSWPWGPLPPAALYDPTALGRLPLARYFDGIDLIVARSDWTPDATYVTFKAGDNFWSHSHLDQGAFTIYKGGALAIDSGLYGTRYGSDHHMNYTYQTIAHNTVTVTDPRDTVPDPGRKGRPPRPIANDGGQRRIGSGWGIEAAPLDLNEWQAKYDIYHTGTLKKVFMQDGLIVIIADLTAAYTNRFSGKGTFSHRTRRVERFLRVFVYDRSDDVVIVFDRVTSTRADFAKRWILHSIEKPALTADGFDIHISPENRPGHHGGSLSAHVLLPKNPYINSIGGPGFEFFVDDRNYDENGKVGQTARKKIAARYYVEPGAWRVEVSPSREALDDTFLVVMLPTLGDRRPIQRVRYLDGDGRPGCEIAGPHRTTRWRFNPDTGDVHAEIIQHGRIEPVTIVAPAS